MTPELDLGRLHDKQTDAYRSLATEILYGGAAGGGKSHLFRVLSLMWCASIPGLQVYLFRRELGDLQKNHLEGPKGYKALLAPWTSAGLAKIVEGEIRFLFNGARIWLCHCKNPDDIYGYQGAEMHVLLIDELTQWLDFMYRFLRSRVRAPGLVVPPQYAGQFPRILAGTNPGGIGHGWVKQTFIDGARPGEIRQMPASEGGMRRQYIEARLEDNPSMATDDPTYEARLHGLGSEALVKAMRYGIWDIVAGAFFDNYRRDRHVLKRWSPPKHWTRYRAMDWGSAKPFSVGWYAIADDDAWAPGQTGEVRIPRGALVRYREWYGCQRDEAGRVLADTGLKLDVEDVAAGILRREVDAGEQVDGQLSVADPSMWKEDGGPSLIERLVLHRPKWWKPGMPTLTLQPADNTRVTGWQQVRARLNGTDDGDALLFVTEDCTDFIRTVPVLQHDKHKPEDVDSDGEDHVADEVRYACMARPLSRAKKAAPSGPKPWSLDWIVAQDEAAKARMRRR